MQFRHKQKATNQPVLEGVPLSSPFHACGDRPWSTSAFWGFSSFRNSCGTYLNRSGSSCREQIVSFRAERAERPWKPILVVPSRCCAKSNSALAVRRAVDYILWRRYGQTRCRGQDRWGHHKTSTRRSSCCTVTLQLVGDCCAMIQLSYEYTRGAQRRQ